MVGVNSVDAGAGVVREGCVVAAPLVVFNPTASGPAAVSKLLFVVLVGGSLPTCQDFQ